MTDLEICQAKGFITKLIGNIPAYNLRRIALLIQARSIPKKPFRAIVKLTEKISPFPLGVFVDDVYSKIFLRRSRNDQNSTNLLYDDFFKELGLKACFSSELYNSPPNNLVFENLFQIASNIPLSGFISCLPIAKREDISRLDCSEMLHALFELLLMENVKLRGYNTFAIGQTSEAIVHLYRGTLIASEAVSAIVTPKFNNQDEIRDYIKGVGEIKFGQKI